MGNRLNNKVAIVTGGGAGIGEAISKKFAREGAKVVVCGLPNDPVREVVREIQADGGTAVAFLGDISQVSSAQACVRQAIDSFGKLDILINNAGVFPAVGTIDEYPVEALEYLLRNNIQSVFMMTKFAIPYLQKTKGCVVSAGSEAGIDGDPQNAPYSGTKGYIHAFSRALASEQAQYGVRVNVVCPGPIDTAWTNSNTSPMTTKMEKMIVSATPMGRRGTPEEVANVYLFLASDEASYVTGALYTVDGGLTISKGPSGLMADSALKKAPEGELDLQHSKEGDTVKRPFKVSEAHTEAGMYREEYEDQPKNFVRNALLGLGGIGLAALAVNVASRYLSGSTPTNTSEVAESSSDTEATYTGPDTTSVADKAVLSPDSPAATTGSTSSPQPSAIQREAETPRTTEGGPAETKNGNDKGFTNEAATGNTD